MTNANGKHEGYLSNFDALQRWFYGAKNIRWSLFRGGTSSRRLIMNYAAATDLDTSYHHLVENLKDHGINGGLFCISTYSEDKKELPKKALFKFENQQLTNGQQSAISGFSIGEVENRIEDEVSKRMQIYELEKKVEMLENAQPEKFNFWQQLMNHPNLVPDKLAEVGPKLIEVALNGIFTLATSIINKTNNNQAMPQENIDQMQQSPVNGVQNEALELDVIFEKINQVFPNENPQEVLENLINWMITNKALATTLYHSQIKQ